MGERTAIAWTDSSWNPWYGCTKVSPGCAHCHMIRDLDGTLRPFVIPDYGRDTMYHHAMNTAKCWVIDEQGRIYVPVLPLQPPLQQSRDPEDPYSLNDSHTNQGR
jgi:protein gp37